MNPTWRERKNKKQEKFSRRFSCVGESQKKTVQVKVSPRQSWRAAMRVEVTFTTNSRGNVCITTARHINSDLAGQGTRRSTGRACQAARSLKMRDSTRLTATKKIKNIYKKSHSKPVAANCLCSRLGCETTHGLGFTNTLNALHYGAVCLSFVKRGRIFWKLLRRKQSVNPMCVASRHVQTLQSLFVRICCRLVHSA